MFAGYQPCPVLPARLRQQQLKGERQNHLQHVLQNNILFIFSLSLFFSLLVIPCSLPIYFSSISILCFGCIVSQKAQRKRTQQAKPWLTSPILSSPHLCHHDCSRAHFWVQFMGHLSFPAWKPERQPFFEGGWSQWNILLKLFFIMVTPSVTSLCPVQAVRPCTLQSHNHVHMHHVQHVLPVLVPAGQDEVSVFIYIVLHLGTGGLPDFLAPPACVRPILSCTDVYGCYWCMTFPWVMPTKSKLCLCIRTALFFQASSFSAGSSKMLSHLFSLIPCQNLISALSLLF